MSPLTVGAFVERAALVPDTQLAGNFPDNIAD